MRVRDLFVNGLSVAIDDLLHHQGISKPSTGGERAVGAHELEHLDFGGAERDRHVWRNLRCQAETVRRLNWPVETKSRDKIHRDDVSRSLQRSAKRNR